jgi:hypothetical protein
MQSIKSRRLAFQVSGFWLGLAGISLLFPTLASQIFSMQIVNVGLSSEMGGIMLSVAFIAFISSTDTKRYGALWLPFAVGFVLNALINVYYLLNGHYQLSNAIFNIILNPILAFWLWTSKAVESS